MGITSTQGFKFKLMASGSYGTEQLDLFQDEEIKLSDNVTGLFDLGVLPSDFTRQIDLPGSKKNNKFFEFVYDISVEDPYTFSTNKKVQCWLDFDGIYLSNGYIQLNKVNVYQNKFIDSYSITIYGGLASFGRDLKTYTLTDLPNLTQFNHTSSFTNISSSWSGDLFSGSIVYPLAEYGQRLQYNLQAGQAGIDDPYGALCVQDFKPAIRVKEVWDATFDLFGYTYSSSFMNEAWWDDVYMIVNEGLKYPYYEVTGSTSGSYVELDLETYGLFKTSPISGSGTTDVVLASGAVTQLPWKNIQYNPSQALSNNLIWSSSFDTRIRGEINLSFEITSTGAGSAAPQFDLVLEMFIGGIWVQAINVPLTNINSYMVDIQTYNATQTRTQKFELLQQWNVINDGVFTCIPKDTPVRFSIVQTPIDANTNYTITLDPDGTTKSYLSVTKVNQGGDGLVIDIAQNMPYGATGILLIDFITSIQKKFNLVIYPNKTKLNEFIIEPFSRWYKTGQIKDFNRYINLNEKIEAIPANNFAPQKLNFEDTLDGDYISQQFNKNAGRDYGKQYYVDYENYFSQGEFNVKTGMASSPLIQLPGTGASGSQVINPCPTCISGSIPDPKCYQINAAPDKPISSSVAYYTNCNGVSASQWMGGDVVNAWICAEYGSVTLGGSEISWTLLGDCASGVETIQPGPIYIPTYISSVTYAPARVLPRIFFYNGTKVCQPYIVEHFIDGTPYVGQTTLDAFPYFDNYQGDALFDGNPTSGSRSLLFLNENAVYGDKPTESLYSQYWETYVNLLYKPTTRLFNCQAIIPLADYFKMELNDIVEWRGNYYHLRAINDYNLSNGEAGIQLLGPILGDVISNILPGIPCNFDFSIESYIPECSASVSWSLVSDPAAHFATLEIDTNASQSVYATGSRSGNFQLTQTASLDIYGGTAEGIFTGSFYSMSVKQNGASIYEYFGNNYGELHLTSSCSASYEVFVSSSYSTVVTSSYYYTGLLCGGSIVGEFYSNSNLGDTPGVIYAYSATAGATNQCFDNVTRTYTPNSNPILGVYEDCATCSGCSSTQWKIDNSASGTDCFWGGTDCAGGALGGTVGSYSIAYTPCVKDGTLTTTGFPVVTVDAYC